MRKTTASHLRQKLTLQSEIRTQDTAGGYTRSWQDVADLWAEITSLGGREKLMAMQLESAVTHRIVVRAGTFIDASQRLSGDGRIFYIRSVTPIENGAGLELMAEERAGV
jgi:SPP1 family predicted phage head-tail adaptor